MVKIYSIECSCTVNPDKEIDNQSSWKGIICIERCGLIRGLVRNPDSTYDRYIIGTIIKENNEFKGIKLFKLGYFYDERSLGFTGIFNEKDAYHGYWYEINDREIRPVGSMNIKLKEEEKTKEEIEDFMLSIIRWQGATCDRNKSEILDWIDNRAQYEETFLDSYISDKVLVHR